MSRKFLPAAGYDFLLPFYDPFVKLLGGERAREPLVEQAEIQPGYRVLDIGCGTGAITVRVKAGHPDAEVVGLDPDPKALARAKAKAERAKVSVRFEEGFADALPYPDASFDRVLSAFMFHHLPADEKEAALREARRVLKPGASFHMLDFSGPKHDHGIITRFVHSHEQLKDNAEERVVELMRRAGFANAETVGERRTWFGRVAYYLASTPPLAARR